MGALPIKRRVGDAPTACAEQPTNRAVKRAVLELLDELIVSGRHGEIVLTLRLKDGILMRDIAVSCTTEHRVP